MKKLVFVPLALFIVLVVFLLIGLRRDPAAQSYWIDRSPPGPPPQSMKNQF